MLLVERSAGGQNLCYGRKLDGLSFHCCWVDKELGFKPEKNCVYSYEIRLTGKFLSEVLIFALINQKYDFRLFAELGLRYEKTTSSVHQIVSVLT